MVGGYGMDREQNHKSLSSGECFRLTLSPSLLLNSDWLPVSTESSPIFPYHSPPPPLLPHPSIPVTHQLKSLHSACATCSSRDTRLHRMASAMLDPSEPPPGSLGGSGKKVSVICVS